jgi:transcriptional regulator with XRE-family HTH domain
VQKKSPAHVALGRVIRRRRERLELSQEALAYRCEVDRTYMGGLERGEINPSLTKLLRIADGLEVSLSRLIINQERELEREA